MTDCIFCKIAGQEVSTELVHQAEDFIVIKDIQPQAPVHFLIIPKKHISSLNEVKKSEQNLIGRMLYQAKLLAQDHGLSQRGYKVIVNCGSEGGQVVPHLHFHFLGGKKLTGLV